QGDAALLEPAGAVVPEARDLLPEVPGSVDRAPAVTACPHEQDVTLADRGALGGLRPGKIVGRDRGPRLEPFDALRARQVEQHAPRDYAALADRDGILRRAG